MGNAKEETEKRLALAEEFTNNIKDMTKGIVLVGSVVYSPNQSVNENSDIDLVIIYDDVKDSIPHYFKRRGEQEFLMTFVCDGYLAKQKMDGIAVSIHNISFGALQKIAKAEPDHLIYYRQDAKDIYYMNKDFDSKVHPFKIRSEPIAGQHGVKRFDPVTFYDDGKFVIGNDMDKFLSNSKILHENNNDVSKQINLLWQNTTKRLVEHRIKNQQVLNAANENIADYLCRRERFSPETVAKLKAKTAHNIKLAM